MLLDGTSSSDANWFWPTSFPAFANRVSNSAKVCLVPLCGSDVTCKLCEATIIASWISGKVQALEVPNAAKESSFDKTP